jgi:hypothetical protein
LCERASRGRQVPVPAGAFSSQFERSALDFLRGPLWHRAHEPESARVSDSRGTGVFEASQLSTKLNELLLSRHRAKPESLPLGRLGVRATCSCSSCNAGKVWKLTCKNLYSHVAALALLAGHGTLRVTVHSYSDVQLQVNASNVQVACLQVTKTGPNCLSKKLF